ENLRKTSKRFANLLQKKCIRSPTHLINLVDLSERLSNQTGVLCGHLAGRQFVGSVKIEFDKQNEYLEGKVRVLPDNSIIPVEEWIHIYIVDNKHCVNLLNFDENGHRDGYCFTEFNDPDQIIFRYEHNELISMEYID